MFNIPNVIHSLQCGLFTPEKLKGQIQYQRGRNIYVDTNQSIFEKSFLNAFYVDLLRNRLLLTSSILGFHIYDTTVENNASPISINWEPSETMAMVGLPCASWGPYCACVLLSGCGVKLIVLDGMSFNPLEEINLSSDRAGSTWRWTTMGHELCPHNQSTIAVACTNGNAPIVDLRTGNVQVDIKEQEIDHLTGMKWSQWHENLLATTSAQCISIWDIRQAKSSVITIPWFEDAMSPDIQFLDHSTMIGLRRSSLDFIDINKQMVTNSISVHNNNIRFRRRITFAINYDAKPPLLYLPNGPNLLVIDANSFTILNSANEALFPIEFTLLNKYKHEIYTFCDDEVKVWLNQQK